MTRWPIFRYLLGSHTVFLLMFLAAFYAFCGLILAVAAALTPITLSVVDAAGQPLHWLTLAYGGSAASVLTATLAHGRTRREFLLQHPMFQLVTASVLAAAITGVYALEAALYRAAGWTGNFQDHRTHEAGDYPMIFLTHLSMLAVCTMTGAFLGTAFYRWEAAGGLALLPAAVLVVVAGGANGFFTLPFARFGLTSAPELIAVTVAVVAAGWALLWLSVHDLALRTKVPA